MVWERLEKNNIKTILLVEDEAIIAMAEKMTLEKFGYRVVTAVTGEQALDFVEKNSAIDLILMDINLGDGISGTEAAALILEKHDIPLIFLSGYTEQKVVEKTEGITSYGYIVKDSGEQVLYASIKMAFKLFDAKMNAGEKEKQLQRNEQKYRTLFENMAQGVFFQRADGKIIDSNPAALKMFGLDRKNFIGRTSADSSWKVIREDGTLIPSEEHPSKLALRTGKPVRNKIIAVYNPHIHDYVWLEVNAIPQYKAGQDKPFQVFVTMHDITSLKRMEDLLQLERDRAQSYFDLAGTMILVLDKNGIIRRINSKGCEILNCDEKDLIGKDWFDNIIPEENREEIRSVFQKILEGNDESPYEYVDEHKVLTAAGEEKLILWHNAVLRDGNREITGTISSGEDVTKWVEAQELMRLNEEKYRALYDNAPLPYQSLDKDGSFLDVNPAWLKTLGYIREEVMGENFSEFLHPDWIPHFKKNFPEFKRIGSVHDVQFKIRHKKGHYLDISFEGCAGYHPDGRFRQTYCVFQDITERKQAEERIRTLLEEKELLLKEVHHRIKNNFAFIESSLSLQRRSLDSPEAKEALQDAVSRVSSMRILYDKLLAAHHYSEAPAEEYLTDLVETLISLFPQKKNIKLQKKIEPIQFPAKILFSLGIIVTELLTNIIKYAFPDNAGGLVKIALEKSNNKVQLRIKDNGTGLPAEFRAEQNEGFGLMLVELLSQQLGGRFRIDGKKGTKAVLEFKYESNNP